MNSCLFDSDTATGHLVPLTVSGMLYAISEEEVLISSVISMYASAVKAISRRRKMHRVATWCDYGI